MGTAVFAIATLAITAVGAGVQYSAAQKAAKAQEAAAEYNAKVLQNQAKHEGDVAAENARRQTEQKRRRLAAIRASAAGRGVSFTGSVVDQLEGSAFSLERDIQSGLYQDQVRQGSLRSQSAMTLFEGKSQAAATRSNANAELLRAGASMAGSLYSGQQSGAFTAG